MELCLTLEQGEEGKDMDEEGNKVSLTSYSHTYSHAHIHTHTNAHTHIHINAHTNAYKHTQHTQEEQELRGRETTAAVCHGLRIEQQIREGTLTKKELRGELPMNAEDLQAFLDQKSLVTP
jgi:excinuclease UvrABC ATPase subunit